MACIAMDKASSIYSLALAISYGFYAIVHTSLIWHFWESFFILELVKEANKQTNKQTNNNYDLCFWFGILAWDPELGF
jgi:hypothetical protein